METIKKIFSKVCFVIITILAVLVCYFKSKADKANSKKAEDIKEETKNELEKMSADDIADNSPNADVISSNISKEQEEFRQRIRDRLNQNIQRSGSSGDN